jgi:hypothetical protein
MGNIKAVIFFILLGYIIYCFNKNMVITLAIPLILTSFFVAGHRLKEGFEAGTAAANNPNAATKVATVKTNIAASNPALAANASTAKANVQEKVSTVAMTPSAEMIKSNVQANHAGTETMSNNKKGGKNRVDYAATVEDAYGDLNKILGGDGIKRLTDDTQKLMGQQVQLAEAMKNMTPLMAQAKDMLQGLDLSSLSNIGEMAKQFGVGGAGNKKKN